MNHAEIRALSLVAVRDAIQAGELTSEAVTAAAIEQAERFDRDFALFITFTPDLALEKAREADKTRAAGKRLPPLHGVPITVKDNIDTAGLRTTGGARVFANRVPSEDATVVQKLQAAGAISLGKTNLHEMALGGTTTNPHYGACRNPWSRDRIPGGSSGGAAACESLQIGYAALGTDSGGSVRMPAGLCGLVGLKQTHGIVSLTGCMPTGTRSTDHIGPLTRSVADAALMLSLMQGYDSSDPDSTPHMPETCRPIESLSGLKIGIPTSYFWDDLDDEVEQICRRTVAILEEAGAQIVPVKIETIDLLTLSRRAGMAEAYVFHEPYLRDHFADYGEDIRYRLLAGQYVLAADYIRATRVRRLFMEEVSRVLSSVDVLAMPTLPIPAPPIGSKTVVIKGKEVQISSGGGSTLGQNTMPFNQAGVPAITLPVGCTTDGLPVGLQLVSGAFLDLKLLAIAALVEKSMQFDTTPPILKTLEAVA
ncbi:MAG TPA: amidase [Chloroflexota bacterium]|nr:amidase [Chloroflexota bacterium]